MPSSRRAPKKENKALIRPALLHLKPEKVGGWVGGSWDVDHRVSIL